MEEVEVVESPVQAASVELQQEVQSENCSAMEPEIQLPDAVRTEPPVSQLDLTKLSYELQQAYRIYTELLADSNRNITWPFLEPVDAQSLGLWDYHERIKEPMCFSTIGQKFNEYIYTSITEVVADIRLLLANCYLYNGSDHWVSKLGQKLENVLEQKLALLNRSLRDQVSLTSTMAVKTDFPIEAETEAMLGGTGRRRSGRQNYLQMLNGKNTTSLVTQLKIQEESIEKERRRQREKEKKEANQALLQELDEWEAKELTPDVMNQLHSMWEIPSVASMLYLVKSLLGVEDINLTEFELSFVYPNKSNLLARIFTALLITAHQRKSLHKKPSMKFKMWEAKLKDKVSGWYKLAEKDGTHSASVQLGIDSTFFNILGKEKNLLEEKSYLDLTIHQRIWLLKALCDTSLNKDYDIHDQVVTSDFMEQRELFLGVDADDNSYLYFPVFQTTDVRIYKHVPYPVPTDKKKEEKARPETQTPQAKKPRKVAKPSTPRASRLRQRRGSPEPSPESEPETEATTDPPKMDIEEKEEPPPEPTEPVWTIDEGFSLACHDIETLRSLCDKFAEKPAPPKRRGRKARPPPLRKKCDVELHETFEALFQELEKYEATFTRTCSKAKMKVMKESQEPEPVDEPEEVTETVVEDWGSEESDDDAGATLDSDDEEYTIENEGTDNKASKKRKGDSQETSTQDAAETSCSIEIQTAPPKFKKRRVKVEEGQSVEAARKKPRGWSPKKDEVSGAVLSALQAGRSPAAVIISAVSAEESVKAATTVLTNPEAAASRNDQTSAETVTTVSANSGGSLEPTLVQATASVVSSAVLNPPATKSIITEQPLGVKPCSPAAGSEAANRKRILMTPEGQTHEVKAFIEGTSLQKAAASHHSLTTTSTKTSILAKAAVGTQNAAPTVGQKANPSAGLNKVMIIQGGKPVVAPVVGAQSRPAASSAVSRVVAVGGRPNILSHSRKQVMVSGRPVNVVSSGTPGATPVAQTNVTLVTTSLSQSGPVVTPRQALSHNHTYTNPSTAASQTGVGISSQQSTAVTGSGKVAVPAAQKTGGQSRLASTIPKGITTQGKPLPTASGAKATVAPMTSAAKTATGRAHVAVSKVQASALPAQTKQTRIVVVPASSVGPNSPLAGLTPSLITTGAGQKILGYAVVVPTGSEGSVTALLNRGAVPAKSSAPAATSQGISSSASSQPKTTPVSLRVVGQQPVSKAAVASKGLPSKGLSTTTSSASGIVAKNVPTATPARTISTPSATQGVSASSSVTTANITAHKQQPHGATMSTPSAAQGVSAIVPSCVGSATVHKVSTQAGTMSTPSATQGVSAIVPSRIGSASVTTSTTAHKVSTQAATISTPSATQGVSAIAPSSVGSASVTTVNTTANKVSTQAATISTPSATQGVSAIAPSSVGSSVTTANTTAQKVSTPQSTRVNAQASQGIVSATSRLPNPNNLAKTTAITSSATAATSVTSIPRASNPNSCPNSKSLTSQAGTVISTATPSSTPARTSMASVVNSPNAEAVPRELAAGVTPRNVSSQVTATPTGTNASVGTKTTADDSGNATNVSTSTTALSSNVATASSRICTTGSPSTGILNPVVRETIAAPSGNSASTSAGTQVVSTAAVSTSNSITSLASSVRSTSGTVAATPTPSSCTNGVTTCPSTCQTTPIKASSPQMTTASIAKEGSSDIMNILSCKESLFDKSTEGPSSVPACSSGVGLTTCSNLGATSNIATSNISDVNSCHGKHTNSDSSEKEEGNSGSLGLSHEKRDSPIIRPISPGDAVKLCNGGLTVNAALTMKSENCLLHADNGALNGGTNLEPTKVDNESASADSRTNTI